MLQKANLRNSVSDGGMANNMSSRLKNDNDTLLHQYQKVSQIND